LVIASGPSYSSTPSRLGTVTRAEHDVEHLNVRAAQVLDPDMAAGRPGDFHVPSPYSDTDRIKLNQAEASATASS
jgi:hypothetical protein